jgi:peptidoglycan/LPS O-acetylase OafA/YrhL
MGGERQYHAGIDGMRAVAVALVLVFHSGLGWMPGGFLGVSVFFTLSGFLITGLLLAEIADPSAPGRVSLRRFWSRRVRRLAPASLVCLAVVAALGPWLAGPSGAAAVHGDVVAALAYVANWRFVAADQSYAELFNAPSPVLHFWSLAIEEQFYLLFPLLIAGLAWLGLRRRGLGLVLAGLAAASMALSRLLDDADRVYYGTDTRAGELLGGAVLACAGGAWLARRHRPSGSTRALSLAGLVALGAIVGLSITTRQGDGWLYHGGLTGFAGLSAVLVAAAIVPGPARWLLSWGPLVAIGQVSYGLYLFHWPIFVWLTPARLGFDGVPRFVVLVALTGAVAVISHRFLERPVRERRWPRTVPVAVASFATAMLVVATATLVLPRPAAPPAEAALIDESTAPVLLTPPSTPAPQPADALAATEGAGVLDLPPAAPALSAPPPAPTILVVGSDAGLAGALRDALARAGAAAVVVDRADPSCPVYRAVELVEAGAPRTVTCPDFRTTWVRAVGEVAPDAVVAGMGPMERVPYRLAAASPLDDLAVDGPASVRLAELGVTVEVLDALDPPAFLHDAGPAADAAASALATAATSRPEVVTTADVDALASAVASAAAEHAEARVARPTRWLVVGDSTARSVAAGLAAGADGRIEVVAAGVLACPVVRTAGIQPTATETRTTDYCPAWDVQWPTWLTAYEPDALLIVAGASEQWPMQLPGDDAWHLPGSARYVEWHDAELEGMLETVADRGLPILVLEAPDIDTGPDGLGDEPEMIAAWNAQIDRWDERWAAVGEVPYAAYWSDPRTEAGRRERPDGVHPAADVMAYIARTSLVPELTERLAKLERAMRRSGCLVGDAGDRHLDLDRCRADGGATSPQPEAQSSPVGQ